MLQLPLASQMSGRNVDRFIQIPSCKMYINTEIVWVLVKSTGKIHGKWYFFFFRGLRNKLKLPKLISSTDVLQQVNDNVNIPVNKMFP